MRKFDIVLLLPDLKIGGIQRVFITLANEWVSLGYKVCLLIISDEHGTLRKDVNANVAIICFHKKRLVKCFFAFRRFLNSKDVKFFISAVDGVNIFVSMARVLCWNRLTKLVLTEHSFFMLEGESNTFINRYFFPLSMRYFYKKADYVIGVSNGIYKYIRELGVPSQKSCYIYNPINIEEIVRKSWESCAITDRFILYCGRFSPIKNLDLLIRAYNLLLRERQDIKLLLIGEGDQLRNILILVDSLNISKYVIFMPPTSNPYKYMRCADAFVISSFSESYSMAAVESMLVGTTVVSTPNEGVMEVVGKELGYICSSFDKEQEFKECINKALEHPKSKELLVKHAMNFSASNIAKQYLDVLLQM